MKTINIYGKPSYPYDFIKSTLKSLIKEANLHLRLNEIHDMDLFIKDQIEHIPAVRYNGVTKIYNDSNLNQFSTSLKKWILQNENFGTLENIMVPIDYSLSSENALAYAKSLSEEKKYVVNIFHTFFPSPLMLNNQVYIDEGQELREREKFTKYVDFLNSEWIGEKSNGGIPFKSQFSVGFASDEIISFSEDLEDGFIVMGSKGESNIQKRIFGSVSIDTAKKAKCPVLIVPEKARYAGFKNVMYCGNDISLDGNSVPTLMNFFKGHDTNIHLTHFGIDDYDHESLLTTWNAFYDENKVSYTANQNKITKDRIKDFCKKNSIDLIVLARPKRGAFESFLHKSFTKEMAIFSETPLLILNQQ